MLVLLPQHLAATYDYLCEFKPFSDWKLPHSDEVKFTVWQGRDQGKFAEENGVPHIFISSRFIGCIDTLVRVMAHEMIHQFQYMTKTNTQHYHNAAFKQIARETCDLHGWDPLQF